MLKSPFMGEGFTIRIFVLDGDPQGVRLIDRMNWTGLGIVFPRQKWQAILLRAFNGSSSEFNVHLSESVLARIMITVRTHPGNIPDFDVREVEARYLGSIIHCSVACPP